MFLASKYCNKHTQTLPSRTLFIYCLVVYPHVKHLDALPTHVLQVGVHTIILFLKLYCHNSNPLTHRIHSCTHISSCSTLASGCRKLCKLWHLSNSDTSYHIDYTWWRLVFAHNIPHCISMPVRWEFVYLNRPHRSYQSWQHNSRTWSNKHCEWLATQPGRHSNRRHCRLVRMRSTCRPLWLSW